jgi:membrane-bound serine protease (ClpP class)
LVFVLEQRYQPLLEPTVSGYIKHYFVFERLQLFNTALNAGGDQLKVQVVLKKAVQAATGRARKETSIGMLGLLMEFYNPGAIFPGVAGGLALILALCSLGTLNADWIGVLLIILGFVLLALELFVTSFGLLTAGGLIAVTLGSLMLFSGSPAGIRINFGVIAGVVVGIALFVIIAGQAVIKAHRRRATTGMEGMIGTAGIALTVLDPKGTVLFEGERWRARAEDGPIGADEEVVVVRVEGLSLVVRRRGEP